MHFLKRFSESPIDSPMATCLETLTKHTFLMKNVLLYRNLKIIHAEAISP
jgi:hypothetical protein